MPMRTVVALALLLAGCGGGGGGSVSGPVTPATPLPGGAATITLTSAGASPSTVTIPVGGRVNIVNNDSVAHDITSNPHPVHTDCPPLNAAGALAPGRAGQTDAFPTARTCGFHDHSRPSDTRFQGTIVIQ